MSDRDHPWTPAVRHVTRRQAVEVLHHGTWQLGAMYSWRQHEDGRWSTIVTVASNGRVMAWADEVRPAPEGTTLVAGDYGRGDSVPMRPPVT